MEAVNVDQLSNQFLLRMNAELAGLMKGDCVFIHCSMIPPLDSELRVVIEDISKKRGGHLVVVLQTPGGYMETVERLVSVMRFHYKEVSFVIPDYAYSAGTVLALSGDKIYMDYYSVLGPIDPQYTDKDGKLLPGSGYLRKFEELISAINNPEKEEAKAELAYLITTFDPALLFHIEQGIEHGRSLITEWLPKYKFKSWKETETEKKKVTDKMKKDRARDIAKVLGNAERWHSHGRGISRKDLESDEIKLKIDDFGTNKELNNAIRHYHGYCVNYYSKRVGVRGYIHSSKGFRRI